MMGAILAKMIRAINELSADMKPQVVVGVGGVGQIAESAT
jgi:hypothetical protein